MGGGETEIPGRARANAVVLGWFSCGAARDGILARARASVARSVSLHARKRRKLENRKAGAVKVHFASTFIALILFLCPPASAGEPRVLVYQKNGKGFVHDNLAASAVAIQALGKQNGF